MASVWAKLRGDRPREEKSNSRYLSQREEICDQLRGFRDQRVPLTLRLDGQAEEIRCKVVDLTDSELLIDDISPRSAYPRIQPGTKLSISGRLHGTFIYVEQTQVTELSAERGVPYFHLALPKHMLLQQRRKSARYRIPLTVNAEGASITLFRQEPLDGEIIDISVGGCRAEFNGLMSDPLKSDEIIENCAISVPRRLDVNGTAAIRHFKWDKHRNKLICGIELVKMSVTDRRRLEQFVQSLSKAPVESRA